MTNHMMKEDNEIIKINVIMIIKIKQVITTEINNNKHKIKVSIKLIMIIKKSIMKKIKNNKKRHIKNNQIINLI